MVICTVVLTTIAVRREFAPVPSARRPAKNEEMKTADWSAATETGERMGPMQGQLTVVEFSDFQCPFCEKFSRALASVRTAYPTRITTVFHNFPLTSHSFAYAAARAAECAGAQGAFERYHDVLFAKRDSVGKKSFVAFANEAGVKDLAGFEACNASTVKVGSIERDIAMGRRLGVRGTPTVFLNGWRFAVPPDSARLDSALQASIKRATGG